MKTKSYLLTITILICFSCKDKNTIQPNTDIQKVAENALYNQLEELNADAGIAIVMETETGIIKAVANNNFSENDSIEIGGLFSTVSMMIALDDNIVSLNDKIDVGNGEYQYAGHTLRDHNFNRGGYGEIAVKQIIPFASNIGIAKVVLKGYENNPQKFINGLNQLGFTNIPKSENWRKTTLAWLSVGGLAFGRGNAKARTGDKTFKFPQNFLRAYTPHDAKPFVGCSVFLFFLLLFKCTSNVPFRHFCKTNSFGIGCQNCIYYFFMIKFKYCIFFQTK